jgi:hypothetical protein
MDFTQSFHSIVKSITEQRAQRLDQEYVVKRETAKAVYMDKYLFK